jgi:hypothetical protein
MVFTYHFIENNTIINVVISKMRFAIYSICVSFFVCYFCNFILLCISVIDFMVVVSEY